MNVKQTTYRGKIQVKVRSDIPYQIIEGLLDMGLYWKEIRNNISVKRIERVEKLNSLNYKFFKSPQLNNFVATIDPVVMIPWVTYSKTRMTLGEYLSLQKVKNGDINTMFKEVQKLSKLRKRNSKFFNVTDRYPIGVNENVCITECKESLRDKDSYVALMINVVFEYDSSHYNKELFDFLDMVRPYLYEGHPNEIGHVEDENGILDETIYISQEVVTEQLRQLEVLCGSCSKYNLDKFCKKLEICKETYRQGKPYKIK